MKGEQRSGNGNTARKVVKLGEERVENFIPFLLERVAGA